MSKSIYPLFAVVACLAILEARLFNYLCKTGCLFTQPPMRRMRIMFYRFFLFFPRFFPSATKYKTTVLGNGWTDFHETFTKRYRRKWSLKRPAASWRKSCRRLANVDDFRNLRYDSGGITRGRHARRLRLQMHELATGFNLVIII